MEHKAFLFDTQGFDQELRKIIVTSGEENEPKPLHEYIVNNIGKVRSVYTRELLENNWENELELGGVQELADFAMTCFYSPEDDRGLSYLWDAPLETLKMLPTKMDPEYYILGHPIESETFSLDPGGMGLGIIEMNDIPVVLKDLKDLRGAILENGMPLSEVLYEHTFSEIVEAYDELIKLYNEAADMRTGLLMTF